MIIPQGRRAILFLFLITLFTLLTIPSSSAAENIKLILYRSAFSVYQSGSNRTYFEVWNEHSTRLYYLNFYYTTPSGVRLWLSPSGIGEMDLLQRQNVFLEILANESAKNGTYFLNLWAVARDDDWNEVKSPTYTINLTVLINYTIPPTTTSTTSTTTSSTSTTTTSTTTSSVPIWSKDNETFSKKTGGKISKNQIILIIAVAMIILILIPIFTFRKKSVGEEQELSSEDTSSVKKEEKKSL